jgi:LysR family glycine cleavage system transcriptional activator
MPPLSRRLPPLNALRAFESAARHGSFQGAAAELHVTGGAVAQQVKQLEEWLGLPLFRRMARGVILTEIGQLYSRALGELFDRLASETERALKSESAGVLTVSTTTTLATMWLIPRLGKLKTRDPLIQVRVHATSELTDFRREGVDVAIRHGTGRYADLHVVPLMPIEFMAVCSPALLAGPHPLRTPADLRFHALLHDEAEPLLPDEIDWPRWLRRIGIAGIDAHRGPRFSHTHMTLQAAAAGHGVALGATALAADALASGTLVRPFTCRLRGPYAYYLVEPAPVAERSKLASFRQWLLDEAQETLASIPEITEPRLPPR